MNITEKTKIQIRIVKEWILDGILLAASSILLYHFATSNLVGIKDFLLAVLPAAGSFLLIIKRVFFNSGIPEDSTDSTTDNKESEVK